MDHRSFFEQNYNSKNEFITRINDIDIYIKREDLIHPIISGNKFRKLKYNLTEAMAMEDPTIVTFGGAFSNHIAATAEACHMLGMKSIGIVRGDELGIDFENTLTHNSTLRFAYQKGMKLAFVTREDYRLKENMPFVENLKKSTQNLFCISEGGTNSKAILGCKEILTSADDFDVLCCSVGTGGTFAGLVEASTPKQQCIGFSALKGEFLKQEIKKWTQKKNWSLQTNYHFGGYAKVDSELIHFMNQFWKKYHIPLDPVYTAKMFFGLFGMMESGLFSKNTRILAIHTGGLQGIEGMNKYLKKKGCQTINYH
ncbi:pyridoxal-phosphate dependent enzyme [Psychroflexus tropicus]|uniref:1-aminocyclopropane-1-carboxylate deaminase/D-cysteine desulfhydrase n=1 Tax=Psychroflexus tropicus TaxID=197345 RepID=UPI00036D6D88